MWECRQAPEKWCSAGFVLAPCGPPMHRRKPGSEEWSGPCVSALTLFPEVLSPGLPGTGRHLSGSFFALETTLGGLNLGSSGLKKQNKTNQSHCLALFPLHCLAQIKCSFIQPSVNYLLASQQCLEKSCYSQHLLNCFIFSTLWRLFFQWLSPASSFFF